MKFTRENGCPQCGEKKYSHIIEGDLLSNIYCEKCRAIYRSPLVGDSEEAGEFLNRYFPSNNSKTIIEHNYAKIKHTGGTDE